MVIPGNVDGFAQLDACLAVLNADQVVVEDDVSLVRGLDDVT